MAKGLEPKKVERIRKRLERKHGKPYVILRASNGEVAILPKARAYQGGHKDRG